MCGICSLDEADFTLCGKHRLRWDRLDRPPVAQFVRDSIRDPMHGLSWLTCKECGSQFRAQKYRATCNEECAIERRRRQSREAKRREDPEVANERRRQYRAEGRKWLIQAERNKVIAARKHETCVTCGKSLLGEYRRVKFCCDECARIDLAKRATQRRRQKGVGPRSESANDAIELAAIALSNRPENSGRYVSTCQDCGVQIRSKTGRRIVCAACRKQRNIQRNKAKQITYERTCEFCESVFSTSKPNAKYCTRRCAKDAINARKRRGHQEHHKTCEICGSPFVSTMPFAKLCSDECRSEDKRRKARQGWAPEIRKCQTCGNAFTQNSPAQIHCSSECKVSAKRKREQQRSIDAKPPCRICGKKLPLGRPKFCSDECYQTHRKNL